MRRLLSILLTVCLITSAFTAWAYWTAGSAPGGNGAADVTSVNQGATPTATVAGNAVTVAWAATTLTIGKPVTGYTVKRYSGSIAQTILTACTGTIAGSSCVENNVPTGVWTYSVTPVFATNWVGFESAKSSNVVVGNVAPTAVADSYSVAEDAVKTVVASGVLGNDSDPNGDPITAILYSGVANGAVSLSANGGFTYTPNPAFNGTDSFSYKANDGTQDSNVVTVTLTVTAVNDAPVNSVPGTQETPKGTNRVFSAANNNPISISDADAGGATVQVQLYVNRCTMTLPVTTGLTFSVGDGTDDTTMTFTGTIATINSRLDGATFVWSNNFTGAATLQIVTSDLGNTGSGGTLTDTDSITINVNPLGIFTANQDIGAPSLAGSSTYSGGANGTYTVKGSGADIWTPPDQFQYLYRDLPGDGRLTAKVSSSTQSSGNNTNAKAGVMLRETTATGGKQAMMDLMQTAGTEFMFRVTADQTPATSGAAASVVAPYWIRITRVGNVITGEYSPDGVTWTTEGTAQTVAMTTSIKVGLAVTSHDNTKLSTVTYDNVALTTPPTAAADAYTTNENATLTVAARGVLANDTDPESDALTAVLVSGTTGLTLNANGSFTYVPPANFTGTTSFTYKANDGVFYSTIVTVTLTVNPANQLPSFIKGANQSTSLTGVQTVAGWATAISQGTGESGQLVDFVVTNTNNPLFSVQPAVSAAGTLTYTPAGPTGVATVSVNIHDNGGTANGGSDSSAVQTFTITVVLPDVTPPVNAISLSVVTGGSYKSGSTIYYRGTAAGSFALPNAVSDAGSGPASSATAALGGTTTGWSHTPSTVSTPAGGPYVSNSFSWTAGTTSGPTEVVTGRDVAGNTAQTTLTFANDSTAPTSGTVTYAARTSVDTTVSVSFATGTDAGSGVGTRLLQRASATLTGPTCGGFGAFATVSGGTNPTSAVVDTTIPGNCYMYQYVVADNVGNSTTATSVNIWKVAIATQWAYVANNGTNNVTPVNVSTGAAGTPIAVGTGPRGVAFTPDGTLAYVTNTTAGTVSVITVATGAVAATITGFTNPRGVAFTPDGIKAYVTNYVTPAGTVTPITVATNTKGTPITGFNNPSGVAFTPDGTKAYVTNNGSGTVTPITVSNDTAGTAITVGSGPTGVAFTPDGTKAYVANFTSGNVTPITVSTNTAGTAITVGTQPFGLAITPDGAKVYVANYGSGTVTPITVSNNTAGTAITVGTNPYNVAITPDGTAAYVTNYGSGTVTPITMAGNTAGTAITVGTGPYGVSMVPDQGPTAALAPITGAAAGSPVSLDATGSTGTATAIATYTFDFGDASTPTTSASPTTAHTYASAGSFTVTLTVTDTAGTSTTRVFTGQTVSRNGSAAATTTRTVTITAADTTGPTGGSVDASGLVGTGSRYAASTTLSLVFAKGTDPSGVAATGNLLKRATATLTSGGTADGTCGAFGSYTTVSGGTDPVSPKSDIAADQACYSYQYVVLDTLGNSTTYTSPAIKVDLAAPAAPSLAHSAFTNTYWASGSIVYYRSAAGSGSFTTTATATDTTSGIVSYAFPALGTNWTSTPGALGVNTYSWGVTPPQAPGAKNITATNNAASVSGGASFTPTADDTAPSAGSVTPPNGSQASTSVSVAFTTGTDGGSGLGTRLLQRQSATLSGTCGSYGGWTTVATNPASSPLTDTVAGGFCYQYQYVVADNVGNTNTATSGSVVQVTATSSPLKAQYNNNEPTTPTNNSIQPHLQLVNTSASPVDLSTITVRYWFTKEAGASTFATPCYYATAGCSNVTTSVVVISPRTGADAYLLVGFQPSTLAAGASSEVQLGLNKTDWSNFNELDDYSYGTGTTYADSTTVTVYQAGTLIWGIEPT